MFHIRPRSFFISIFYDVIIQIQSPLDMQITSDAGSRIPKVDWKHKWGWEMQGLGVWGLWEVGMRRLAVPARCGWQNALHEKRKLNHQPVVGFTPGLFCWQTKTHTLACSHSHTHVNVHARAHTNTHICLYTHPHTQKQTAFSTHIHTHKDTHTNV